MRFMLLLGLTLVGCSAEVKNVTPTYSVTKPLSNKHHAIFQIRGQNGGGCTAFVISNRRAITAGHCVEISKTTLSNKKDILTDLSGYTRDLGKAISQVNCEEDAIRMRIPQFACERALRGMKRQYKDLSSYMSRLRKDQVDTFKVINSEGVELAIKPVALDSEFNFRDFAVLQGDFSEFEKLPIVSNLDVAPGELLRSCGFANLKIPATCTNFIASGNSAFAYKGNGYLVKGMSGGPVLNSKGEVVGINVAVGEDAVLMTPVVGVLDRLPKLED